jgi:hypothetical protein
MKAPLESAGEPVQKLVAFPTKLRVERQQALRLLQVAARRSFPVRFEATSGAGIFADTAKRCGPVKKVRFSGDDPVIPFTIPVALGGTGIVKRKMDLSAETSHTSNRASFVRQR